MLVTDSNTNDKKRLQYLRKKMLHKVPDIKKNLQTNKRPQ